MWKNFTNSIIRVMGKISEANTPNDSSSLDKLKHIVKGRVEKSSGGTDIPPISNTLTEPELKESGVVVVVRERKPKNIRYAVMLAYQGKNYYGMQIQSTYPTIEGKLVDSLYKYGMITEEEAKNPNKFYFQRAARTDRAVSAVRQICSMMMPKKEEFLLNGPDKLNEYLPSDIRVLGVRRATPSFHAQKSCDARTYSYTLPTFAFSEIDQVTDSNYRISEEQIKKVDEILGAFVGSHNFFNYTARKDHSDVSCRRFIHSFKCDKPFTYKHGNVEYEFITIYIKGQSFMMHQIRKMIGATIAIVRKLMYLSDIQKSFEENRMDIPKAPGNGLLLEKLHYESYDKRFSASHDSLNNWGEEVEARIEKAKKELILYEILDNEIGSQIMFEWLSGLMAHSFLINSESEQNCESEVTQLSKASHLANEIINPTTGKTFEDLIDDDELESEKPIEDDFNEEKEEKLIPKEILEENFIEKKVESL